MSYEIINRHGVDELIYLGLASSNIYNVPGCCGLCAAVLNSVNYVSGLQIYRTADFLQNMPQKSWDFPYKLLNTAKKSFIFLKNLSKQYEIAIESKRGDEEAYSNLIDAINEYERLFNTIDDIDLQIEYNQRQLIGIENLIKVLSEQASEEQIKLLPGLKEAVEDEMPHDRVGKVLFFIYRGTDYGFRILYPHSS